MCVFLLLLITVYICELNNQLLECCNYCVNVNKVGKNYTVHCFCQFKDAQAASEQDIIQFCEPINH